MESRTKLAPKNKIRPPKAPKPPKPVIVDPFPELASRYEQRLGREWRQAFAPMPVDAPEIAFLITPWLGTAVPMFSVETALLTRSEGHAVRLILDDTEVAQNAEVAGHRDAVRRMVRPASEVLPVSDVSLEPDSDGSLDMETAVRICHNIAIWWERGESAAPAFYERNPRAVQLVAAHLAKVRSVLAAIKPCRLFIPGGIFGLSAIYVHIATELGLPYTTYDSNHHVVMVSRDSVACHRRDFPAVLSRIRDSLTVARKRVVHKIVAGVLRTHQQGRDELGIQMVAARQSHVTSGDVLVPLNIRWDAAALGCELCFPSCMAWLEALLAWVERDGRFSICLREHPAGRFAGAGSKDDYAPLLRRFRGLGSRMKFIAADAPVNTYDLMASCRLVLPYTSTLGIEAAMLGKPVITHTSAYYADAGFAWAASDAEQYFRLVGDALSGLLIMDESRRESAVLAYYVANCSWFLPGIFNPHPGPFEQWNEMPPARLLDSTGAREIVNALLNDGDIPYYLHEKNMAAA